MSLISNYTKLFFSDNLKLTAEQYIKVDYRILSGDYFSEAIHLKAQLWYVLSYSEVFEDIKYSNMIALNEFKKTVEKIKQ
jgi:hypothetical protein